MNHLVLKSALVSHRTAILVTAICLAQRVILGLDRASVAARTTERWLDRGQESLRVILGSSRG